MRFKKCLLLSVAFLLFFCSKVFSMREELRSKEAEFTSITGQIAQLQKELPQREEAIKKLQPESVERRNYAAETTEKKKELARLKKILESLTKELRRLRAQIKREDRKKIRKITKREEGTEQTLERDMVKEDVEISLKKLEDLIKQLKVLLKQIDALLTPKLTARITKLKIQDGDELERVINKLKKDIEADLEIKTGLRNTIRTQVIEDISEEIKILKGQKIDLEKLISENTKKIEEYQNVYKKIFDDVKRLEAEITEFFKLFNIYKEHTETSGDLIKKITDLHTKMEQDCIGKLNVLQDRVINLQTKDISDENKRKLQQLQRDIKALLEEKQSKDSEFKKRYNYDKEKQIRENADKKVLADLTAKKHLAEKKETIEIQIRTLKEQIERLKGLDDAEAFVQDNIKKIDELKNKLERLEIDILAKTQEERKRRQLELSRGEYDALVERFKLLLIQINGMGDKIETECINELLKHRHTAQQILGSLLMQKETVDPASLSKANEDVQAQVKKIDDLINEKKEKWEEIRIEYQNGQKQLRASQERASIEGGFETQQNALETEKDFLTKAIEEFTDYKKTVEKFIENNKKDGIKPIAIALKGISQRKLPKKKKKPVSPPKPIIKIFEITDFDSWTDTKKRKVIGEILNKMRLQFERLFDTNKEAKQRYEKQFGELFKQYSPSRIKKDEKAKKGWIVKNWNLKEAEEGLIRDIRVTISNNKKRKTKIRLDCPVDKNLSILINLQSINKWLSVREEKFQEKINTLEREYRANFKNITKQKLVSFKDYLERLLARLTPCIEYIRSMSGKYEELRTRLERNVSRIKRRV